MTPEQKALKACTDYARLNAEIKRLKSVIGDGVGACMEAGGTGDPSSIETHLNVAFRPEIVECGWGEQEERYLDDSAIRKYLSVCPHCLATYEAIRARKAARKSFGAAKRQIGMIGRRALSVVA